MCGLVVIVVAALAVGFAAGFVTFRRSLRWCPGCGASLCCPQCPRRPLPVPAASSAAMPAGWAAAVMAAAVEVRGRAAHRNARLAVRPGSGIRVGRCRCAAGG
jgi:hypothetical protein